MKTPEEEIEEYCETIELQWAGYYDVSTVIEIDPTQLINLLEEEDDAS
jgi:hypothetical protein